MAKRFFGLDISPRCTYLAVLDYDRGELSKIQLLESHRQDLSAQLAELTENLDGDFKIGDRLAAALPAKSAYVRELKFPFSETKKILAALPFTISAQIPVAIEDCATAALPNMVKTEEQTLVTAAAVPKRFVQEILTETEDFGMPLHTLDLQPYALLYGLEEQITDGILVAATSQETTISRLSQGTLAEYRLLPEKLSKKNAPRAVREVLALVSKSTDQSKHIYLIGDSLAEEFTDLLLEQELIVKELTMNLAGQTIPAAYFPATALAFRAGAGKSKKSFNFRQGAFALKGEWQKLKRALWASAALILLTVAVIGAAAGLKYRIKLNEADQLQREIVHIYRQTFPNANTIVDVPLQMQSAINDLREKSSLVGGAQPQALEVLKTVSDMVENVALEVQEFNYTPTEARVSGSTTSFEAVNQITEQLTASPLFTQVQVADAQMALKGNKINFRLILTLAKEGAGS